ncbi:MAG: IS110 family transposase, partial [Bosea sp.]|nr:IS110 family transposase [Bosea sp. (in: a-proteobacteria)]
MLIVTSQTPSPRFGIDVSKRWLDIAEYGCAPVLRIDNTAQAIRGWLRTLPPGACHIACESTGTYHRALVELLIGAGHQVYLIDGYSLSRYRDTLGQRAKTDRHDAGLIARYLAHEGARLRPFSLPPRAVTELRALLRRRATLVRGLGRMRQSMEALPGFAREVRAVTERIQALIKRLEQRIAALIGASGWGDP